MEKFIQILRNIKLPVVAIVILVIVLIFTRECSKEEVCPPKGSVLVTQGFLDTLISVVMKPDTLYDTTFIKGDIVYVEKEVPVPVPINPQTNFYTDSIVNDSVSVWVDITVQGVITEWYWKYQPVIVKDSVTITIYEPKPVPFEVIVRKSGLYGSLGIGGNESAFMLTGEIDLITRKDRLYGLQYLRFDKKDFFLFKIGTKLF